MTDDSIDFDRLGLMTMPKLREVARSLGIDVEGQSKVALVSAIRTRYQRPSILRPGPAPPPILYGHPFQPLAIKRVRARYHKDKRWKDILTKVTPYRPRKDRKA